MNCFRPVPLDGTGFFAALCRDLGARLTRSVAANDEIGRRNPRELAAP